MQREQGSLPDRLWDISEKTDPAYTQSGQTDFGFGIIVCKKVQILQKASCNHSANLRGKVLAYWSTTEHSLL